MSTKPKVFIGSSGEAKPIAEAIQILLRDDCEINIWYQGVFNAMESGFDSLLKALAKYDFALFILSGDDTTTSRRKQSSSPRDNVILELGMFIGRIGPHRTVAIKDQDAKVKIPSDLAGITISYYSKHSDEKLASSPRSSVF